MRPEPKEIVALANAILKAEEDLAALRAKWDVYFPPEAPTAPAAAKKGGKSRQPGSLQGSIMDAFERNPGLVFTADDIASLVHANRAKVAANLAKLAYKKKIQTHTRGLYYFDPSEIQADKKIAA